MKQEQRSDMVSMWSACPEWAAFMLTSFYREDEREHALVIQAVHEFIAGWISDKVDHPAPRIGVFWGGPAAGKTVMSHVLRGLRDDDAVGCLRPRDLETGIGIGDVFIEKRCIVVDPANEIIPRTPRSRKYIDVSALENTRGLLRRVAHSDTVEIDRRGHHPEIVTLNHRFAMMTNASLGDLDLYERRRHVIAEFWMQTIPRASIDCSLTQLLTSQSSLAAIRGIAMLAGQQGILPDGVSELRNMLEVMS